MKATITIPPVPVKEGLKYPCLVRIYNGDVLYLVFEPYDPTANEANAVAFSPRSDPYKVNVCTEDHSSLTRIDGPVTITLDSTQ